LRLTAQKAAFQFTNLSTEQGLNTPNVLKILQDKKVSTELRIVVVGSNCLCRQIGLFQQLWYDSNNYQALLFLYQSLVFF